LLTDQATRRRVDPIVDGLTIGSTRDMPAAGFSPGHDGGPQKGRAAVAAVLEWLFAIWWWVGLPDWLMIAIAIALAPPS